MTAPRVTASTMGEGNPSHLGRSGNYKYRGDPDWVPGRSQAPAGDLRPQNVKASAGREARIAGAEPEEAALTVKVGHSTRADYERQFRARYPEATP